MTLAKHEIRADYDRDAIVIYQAYSPAIADAALAAGRFAPPFSLHRMTWIKPSFLWLTHRGNWGRKSAQERILSVRIKRSGWEKALSLACLTSFEPKAFASPDDWAAQFGAAQVHLQWDPERSLRGAGRGGTSLLQHSGRAQPPYHPRVRRRVDHGHRGHHAAHPQDVRLAPSGAGGQG